MPRYKQDIKKIKKVVNKNNKLPENSSRKNAGRKSNAASGFYYSFLTVILAFCLMQITVSAVLNVSKVVSYNAKIVQISKTRDAALALNEQLKDNIKNFSNVKGLEAIARNNLKMSSEDEVLVIINTNKEDEITEEKDKKYGLLKKSN